MNLYLFTSQVQGEALVEFFAGMVPMTDNSKRTGAAIEAHYQFLMWLVPTIEKFPRSHKFTIGDRIGTIAIDVLEALIEATYTGERTQHLRQANLGIEKLRFLLQRRTIGGCPIVVGHITGVRLTVRSVLERSDLAGACRQKCVVSI